MAQQSALQCVELVIKLAGRLKKWVLWEKLQVMPCNYFARVSHADGGD
jgi:hypothetical protein